MVKIEIFYQYLISTYLQQFYKKYIKLNQNTVCYQILGFTVDLKLIQVSSLYLYELTVNIRTPFEEEVNYSYPKIYKQIFSSQYPNLLNEDAPQSGYDQIEAAMLIISMNISNNLKVPPVAAW